MKFVRQNNHRNERSLRLDSRVHWQEIREHFPIMNQPLSTGLRALISEDAFGADGGIRNALSLV